MAWLSGAALFALAPKCLLCLVAYTGLATAFGWRIAGPERCGLGAGDTFAWWWLALIPGGLLAVVGARHLARHLDQHRRASDGRAGTAHGVDVR